ncbi:hypothetical protein KUTeg_005227 [Tegillarca granosa]|uniref:Uncharacterized protein n=1 Tax=Tegillarca granosa TaxID=220873 RepID=A0ABQ9FNP0_TEGGR|nr:hypothetical protein KUTeg_005227 [Tegillarca granosa]
MHLLRNKKSHLFIFSNPCTKSVQYKLPKVVKLVKWLFCCNFKAVTNFSNSLSQKHGYFLLGCLCGLYRQVNPRNQKLGHFYWVVCVVFIDRLNQETKNMATFTGLYVGSLQTG